MKAEIKRDPARATGVALDFEDGCFVLIHPYSDFDRNLKVAECFQRDLQENAEREARIARMSQALQFYADRGNWLLESDGVYVDRIEWNAPGDLWRAPWKLAEWALADPGNDPARVWEEETQ